MTPTSMDGEIRPELQALRERIERTLDEARAEARAKRHAKGYRTARENVADLVDAGSFQEYGQLAVAAQRSRRDYADLQTSTAADGIITGTCTINASLVGTAARARRSYRQRLLGAGRHPGLFPPPQTGSTLRTGAGVVAAPGDVYRRRRRASGRHRCQPRKSPA